MTFHGPDGTITHLGGNGTTLIIQFNGEREARASHTNDEMKSYLRDKHTAEACSASDKRIIKYLFYTQQHRVCCPAAFTARFDAEIQAANPDPAPWIAHEVTSLLISFDFFGSRGFCFARK